MDILDTTDSLIHNRVFIHNLGNLCKSCYIAEIDNLFIYAGAKKDWRRDVPREISSQRMHRLNEWVEGIKDKASKELSDSILRRFAEFLFKNVDDDSTETYIVRQILEGQSALDTVPNSTERLVPSDIDELLERVIKGLPRAMYPLKNRRKGSPAIEFSNEYDVQDLFNSLLQPWVSDIRSEEYTPSYAGSSTRMDVLLHEHKTVCELKFVRDASHAKRVGGELTIDIAHYRQHPTCKTLYAIIYDAAGFIRNPDGLRSDIESSSESLDVKVFIIPKRTLQ